jgi:hypothetical protein
LIKTEYLNNGKLIRYYSDINMYIIQNETQIEYVEAVDVVPCRYTYTETDKPIENLEIGGK